RPLELLFGHRCVFSFGGWSSGSGGGTRTRDPTIMSRVLLPTELLRLVRRARGPAPASPLTDSNPRPLPYHGSALPTELRGQGSRARYQTICVDAADWPGGRPEGVACAGADADLGERAARARSVAAVYRTRLIEQQDAEAVRAIYNVEVAETTVTFDLVPRTL